MNQIKRTLSLLRILLLAAMLFTGCGSTSAGTAVEEDGKIISEEAINGDSPSETAGTVDGIPAGSGEAADSGDSAGTEEDTADAETGAEQAEPFHYEHDPRLNAPAMADIVEDESAVYGFRPSESGSLKQFAAADWSDAAVVEKGREERIAYHDSMAELYDLLGKLRAAGEDIEEIARVVSARRNELRLAAYDGDTEGLAALKARNLETYGHEEGPLPEELYEKYGSWETVLEKSFSMNSGMDACLGLYDDYYELYVLAGQVEED